MKKPTTLLCLILIMSLILVACVGCAVNEEAADPGESPGISEEPSPDAGFNYSDGIADNGLWEDITALDYVELCAYTGISIASDIHEIPDESVQSEVDSILADSASAEQITDRAIADGDTVNIDYVGSVDGVAFDGGSTDGQGADVTIGVTSYIDDFLEQLIGHTPGESFDVEVTFPEEYGTENLNGKDAVFAVTVNYITESVTPELTDDFVAENLSSSYGWNTVDEMKSGIRDELQSAAVMAYVQDYIVENTTVQSVPDSLVTYQEASMLSYCQDYAGYYQMELDAFLSEYMGVSTTDELLAQNRDGNTQKATRYLVIQAIAEDADISITDEDVAAYFAENLGSEDYLEYETNYGMPYLKLMVLHQTILDYLADNAVME